MIASNSPVHPPEMEEELKTIHSPAGLLHNFGLPDLVESKQIDWNSVKTTFRDQPQLFEKALFKLHYKRNTAYDAARKKDILRFLAIGYLFTDDVRYFNEFLWFYRKEDGEEALNNVCHSHFRNNLDGNGHHQFPLATPAEARAYLQTCTLPEKPDYDHTQKVGLIGFPPFFPKIIGKLKEAGFTVEQVFIPYHPGKYVRKALSVPWLVKLLSRWKGNREHYETLSYHHSDPRITPVLQARGFDVGFHKLNCIIRENIFGPFRKGLINDHWAILPFIRGKSTIAYTVLFGFPMVATMHLIEKGVDTGKIVGYSPEFDLSGIKTLAEIRNKIRDTLPDRAVSAIKQLSVPGFVLFDNPLPEGITYYEIHPWLYDFIEKEILSRTA